MEKVTNPSALMAAITTMVTEKFTAVVSQLATVMVTIAAATATVAISIATMVFEGLVGWLAA